MNPDEHDYPAAANYLSLLTDPELAKKTAATFKKSAISKYLAKTSSGHPTPPTSH